MGRSEVSYPFVARSDRSACRTRRIGHLGMNRDSFDSMSQNVLADPWPDRATVPVIEVARTAGIPRYDVRKVELAGLVQHAGREGAGGSLTLTHDDALYLLHAALLALAAGIALVTVVRVLRQTGASLGPGGFTVPIPISP